MAKALRTVAIIAGSVALIATGFGAAVGVGLIVGGSAAVTAAAAGTAATIGTIATLTATAASIGATVASKPPPLGGTATKFLASTSAPLPYVMGRTAVGGTVVYRRTHSVTGISLPDLQTFGVILSAGGPVDAIESFSADNVTTSFTAKRANGPFRDWMFQATQLGETPEAAALSINGLFVTGSKVTSAPPGWGAGNKLSGYAAALWTLRYDQKGKFYANGVPKPLWILRGVKVYDPRLDSTYPGGSGSCRALNESTYVYSTNPYLHALTFILGRWQNGKRVMGIGAPVAGIDVAAFVEGANIAQANGWEVGGIIYSNGGKWGMLKAILQAGGGEPFHLGAQVSCLISTPRVTIATITTNDVVGDASVTATTPRRDRINSVIPRYRSEAHNWEVISADPVTVASHVTTDGGLRTKEIEYGLVQSLDQAAELARYDIENAREFGPIVLPVKTRWVGYKPGDCVAVTLPEVGLNGQAVVIRNRTLDPDGGVVTLTARSETNAKHAFALGQTTTAPPTPGVTAPPPPPDPPTRNATFRQRGVPVAPNDSDLWFDTDFANVQYRYTAGESISIEYAGVSVEYVGLSLTYQTGVWDLVRDGLILEAQRTADAKRGLVAQGVARNGDVVTFTPPLDAVPVMIFGSGGVAGAATDNRVVAASGLTVSGFTMRAVAQAVSGTSSTVDTGAAAGGVGEPDLVINRTNSAAPFDGRYTFNYEVLTFRGPDLAPGEPGTWSIIDIGIWIKRSSAWIQVGSARHSGGGGGVMTVTVTPGAVDFGAGAEFGVSVEAIDGEAYLTAFNSVTYASGTTTETTLTPTSSSPIEWQAWL